MPHPFDRLKAALEDRYAIEEELGAGGMATVYLAEDLKHHRKVALKVLRPVLAAVLGSERFLKEIEVTANLQHPHILPLHDSGEADSFLYYVMPYVAGESLREKLNRDKQLGVDETVKIAERVAAALDYAHRQGVIHRDIKPENILIHDGQPVVADFGIALAVTTAGGTRLTETGLSLGTPQYMSPEQATGEREVTAKSDVYSLGAVVYEMLMGNPPHTGNTVQAIVAKVVSAEPQPINDVRHTVPNNVQAAVQKALAKVPADRFNRATDFAEALVNPAFGISSPGTAERPAAAAKRSAVAVASLYIVVGVALGIAISTFLSGPTGEPPLSFRLPLPLSGYGGGLNRIRLTADCSQVVYQAENRLHVRRLNESQARPIPGTRAAAGVLLSPTNQSIGFFRGNDLVRHTLNGGEPVAIGEIVGGRNIDFYGGSWGTDDHIYFTPDATSGIYRIQAQGGAPEPVTTLDTDRGELSHRFPELLPGREALLYTSWTGNPDSATIMLALLRTKQTKRIGPGTSARYSPTGHLVIGRTDGSLQAAPFDLSSLEATSAFVTVETGVAVTPYGESSFSLCSRGAMLFQLPSPPRRELVLVDSSRSVRSLAIAPRFAAPRLSPEGLRVAVGHRDELGREQIWVYGLDGSQARVTLEGSNFQPSWSPDGRDLVFTSNRGRGSFRLFRKRSDGTGAATQLAVGDANQYWPDWSPDGLSVVYHSDERNEAQTDLWLRRLDGEDPQLLVGTSGVELTGRFAPNGRHVAYEAAQDFTSQHQIWVVDTQDPDSRWPVTVDGGSSAQWTADGRLFYVNGGQLMVATVEFEPIFRVVGRDMVMELGDLSGAFDVSADGQTIVSSRNVGSELQVQFVTNWPERLSAARGN